VLGLLREAIKASAAELCEPSASAVLCAAYGQARVAWAHDRPEAEWLPMVLGMSMDPSAVMALCCEVAGVPVVPDLDPSKMLRAAGMSSRTFAELEHAEREDREAARERWRLRRASTGNGAWQRRRRLLRTCPESRLAFGLSLDGREVGGAVKGLTCPDCGHRTAWFWVAPQRAHRARCNRDSCGWSAPLHEVA